MITGDQNFISRNDLVQIEDKAKVETEKALQEKLEKFDQANKDRKDNQIQRDKFIDKTKKQIYEY